MSKELEQLRKERDEAKRQKEIYEHRLERLSKREKYVRKASDRKRTHRLIQYGVAFEAHEKRLAVLSDVEIFTFIEKLLEIPEVRECMEAAIRTHSSATGGEN